MRLDIQARADELVHAKDNLPESVYEQRKKGMLALLKGMLPGGTNDITAILQRMVHFGRIRRVLQGY